MTVGKMTSGSPRTPPSPTRTLGGQFLSKLRGSAPSSAASASASAAAASSSIRVLKARLRQPCALPTSVPATLSAFLQEQQQQQQQSCSSSSSSAVTSPAPLEEGDAQVDAGQLDAVLTFLDLDALQDFSPPTSSPPSPAPLSARDFIIPPHSSSSATDFTTTTSSSSSTTTTVALSTLSSPQSSPGPYSSEPSSPDFLPPSPISDLPSSPSPTVSSDAFTTSAFTAVPQPPALQAAGVFDSFAPAALRTLLPGTASLDDEAAYLQGIEKLVETYGEGISTSMDKSGFSLIHYASASGFLGVVKYFLKSPMSACLHLLDYYGNNPLLTAVQYNRLPLVTFLVESGVDARHRNAQGHNALRLACDNGSAAALTAILTTLPGIDLNERDQHSRTLLQYACAVGNREVVETLIRHGASPLLKDHTGANSLTTAIMHDHHSFLELLIEDRNILEATDRLGRTPLHWASTTGNLAAVKFLVKNGAKLEQRDKKGRTPFLLASFSHQTHVLQFLRQKKANKDVEDYEGRVPNFSALF